MRILLAGDWHGNTQHMRNVFAHACRENADIIVQLGDFGWGWQKTQFKGTGGKVECGLTHEVSEMAQKTGIPCYWIDGNHEDFDFLEKVLAELEPQLDGTYEVAPMVFYVPRGTLMVWDTVKFLCCGGAVSVDKKTRTPFVSWWPQESINLDDVDKCIAAGPAQVLLTHDFPWECNIVDRHLDSYWGEEANFNTRINRQTVSAILQHSKARKIFHGHLHLPYLENIVMNDSAVTVRGLDRDTTPMYDSTYLFDTETLAHRQLVAEDV